MKGSAPTVVADTNVLLNLALPVVDSRDVAPSGGDPLRTFLTVYDVHVPSSVLGEITDASQSDDLLAAAAELVLFSSSHLTTHDVETDFEQSVEYGLDRGESHGIWLTNELAARMFVTDEFNSTNYLLVSLALDGRNTLFTTPHVLCWVASRSILDAGYVDALLSYYVETKGWDRGYIQVLRRKYLGDSGR